MPELKLSRCDKETYRIALGTYVLEYTLFGLHCTAKPILVSTFVLGRHIIA